MNSTAIEKVTVAKPENADGLPSPPLWLKWSAHYFRLGFATFLCLSTLLGLVSCSQTPTSWKPATQVVSETLLKDVIAQNATLSGTEAIAALQTSQAWSVPSQDGKLVLINFNTPSLCGQLGCLYIGIWTKDNQPPQQVFASYLNPNLPQGKKLFEPFKPDATKTQQQQALPCLKVAQVDAAQSNGVRAVSFCFDGRQYRVVEGSLQAPSTIPSKRASPAVSK